jgi:hypothetical protein
MDQITTLIKQLKTDDQPSTLPHSGNSLQTRDNPTELTPPVSLANHPFAEKRIVALAGNRGGTGKTTMAVTLYEWYSVNGINVFCYDYENENRESSCFSHFVQEAARSPLNYERDALDQMLRELETKQEAILLADFGAGSQRDTIQFYKDYYEMLIDNKVRLTLVGVLDSDVGALKGILKWPDNMSAFPKIDWMIVLNEKDVIGEKFRYWHRSPAVEPTRSAHTPFPKPGLSECAAERGTHLAGRHSP